MPLFYKDLNISYNSYLCFFSSYSLLYTLLFINYHFVQIYFLLYIHFDYASPLPCLLPAGSRRTGSGPT